MRGEGRVHPSSYTVVERLDRYIAVIKILWALFVVQTSRPLSRTHQQLSGTEGPRLLFHRYDYCLWSLRDISYEWYRSTAYRGELLLPDSEAQLRFSIAKEHPFIMRMWLGSTGGLKCLFKEVRDRLSQGVGSNASVVVGEKRGRIASIVVNIFEKCIMVEDARCCGWHPMLCAWIPDQRQLGHAWKNFHRGETRNQW